MIQEAKHKWHLRKIQITLDGTKDKYNQIKSYINKEHNPFGRVLRNIREMLDNDIYVTIRLNLSLENYSDLVELVDYLADNFLTTRLAKFMQCLYLRFLKIIKTEKMPFQNY